MRFGVLPATAHSTHLPLPHPGLAAAWLTLTWSFPMNSRHNFIVRAVGTLAGDAAAGIAMASACTWIIQSAALGMFLSFVAWLIAIVATLAISQFVVHPIATTLLSDSKLDEGIAAVTAACRATAGAALDLWHTVLPATQPEPQPVRPRSGSRSRR
jgi:hypothetical protein